MMTIEQVVEKLQDRNLTKVAKSVGITRVYLSAIANGKQLNPSYEIVKKLSDYLEK